MPLSFYYDLLSQPSRALYIILRMSNIKYQDCVVALRHGEHLTEQFRNNINRFQKVPCIIDNGYKLAESIAILRYLSAKGLIPDVLYPKDYLAQSRVDEFLEWQHITLRATCALYFRAVWLEPLMTGKPTFQKKINKLEEVMETNLNIMENVWLENTQFLCNNTFTAADIFAACEIEQTRMTTYDVRSKYPKIRQWLNKVRNHCNPHYDDAHRIVDNIAKKTISAKL